MLVAAWLHHGHPKTLPCTATAHCCVATKGPTRLEMVCRHLNTEDPRARPAWDVALRIGLIEATGVDRLTGQAALFTLTDRGRRAVRELGPRRRRD